MFFNMNHMTCRLEEESMDISNNFSKVSLQHDNPRELINLMEAINKRRVSIGPEDLYPKKYLYINSKDFESIDLS